MIEILSPIAGWLTSLDAVPDPVFAERMLGDGVAIDPIEGVLRAPVAGRILNVHASRHAVTIESDAGAVLLLHIGLETVGLRGEGFEARVEQGAHVEPGDPLIAFDLDRVGRRARSLVIPMIVTNGDRFAFDPPESERLVGAGDPILILRERAGAAASAPAVAVAAGEEASRAILVPLRDGIHARPAARIAEYAARFEAAVELVAADGRAASARSPVAMLALALPHGAAITVRAAGRDAPAAAEAVAALIESGMGEAAPIASPAAAEAPPAEVPAVLRGVTAVPGLALGPAFRLTDVLAEVARDAADPAAERRALDEAIAEVRAGLDRAARGDGPAASIAAAHGALLADPELLAAADRAIGEGRSAAFAWKGAIERYAALLGGAGDARFAERVADLRDLERGVVAALSGGGDAIAVPAGAVLVADDILPSQIMALADAGLAGIATARGGPTSHAAIIAAGMGLPMLVAAGADALAIPDGTMLLLDAGAGSLTVDPAPDLIARIERERAERAAFRAAALARAHEPARTLDGAAIEIVANLGSLADARAAAATGAEGCGLLRTEFLFLDRDAAPDEEEQRATYQAIADALEGRPLIVRTLDIGADKPARYLPMAAEDNPALGLRGIRLGLARRELLASQLRALVRVEGALKIMLPMVADPGELAQARALLAEAAQAAGRPAPELGVMVETPAAALIAPALAEQAAFFSIGSNDLSQYALARDRGNPAVAAGLDALHPAVLRLIAMTVEGGRARGRWTGVCGGLAADPAAAPLLIGLGVTELSVPPAAVAETKARVRALSLAECRRLAEEALALGDAAAVRGHVARFLGAREEKAA